MATGSDVSQPAPIRRLDAAVVNRIAAGEIIHRPSSALKELLENALDARATSIKVTVKDGGLKLLQIQDDGSGIRKIDLPHLCERFTTSKLQKFSDLASISTYGFRGEALASISFVSHLTVTTKTRDDACAWRLSYADSKPVKVNKGGEESTYTEARPCAGNDGTLISAEDLFYNTPTRLSSLRSSSDEYARVLDVVSRYAIHNPHVAFSCKKLGSGTPEISTHGGGAGVDTVIRVLHGPSVARELIHVEVSSASASSTPPSPKIKKGKKRIIDKDGDETMGNNDDENEEDSRVVQKWDADAYISSANYHVKKMVFLLFINHRAVESTRLKRAMESVYMAILPKGCSPFVYLSLNIDPASVDVNVHPTKREVHFLNEDKIIEALTDGISSALAKRNDSRTFEYQTLLTDIAPASLRSGQATTAMKDRVESKFRDAHDRSTPRTVGNSKLTSSAKSRPGRVPAELVSSDNEIELDQDGEENDDEVYDDNSHLMNKNGKGRRSNSTNKADAQGEGPSSFREVHGRSSRGLARPPSFVTSTNTHTPNLSKPKVIYAHHKVRGATQHDRTLDGMFLPISGTTPPSKSTRAAANHDAKLGVKENIDLDDSEEENFSRDGSRDEADDNEIMEVDADGQPASSSNKKGMGTTTAAATSSSPLPASAGKPVLSMRVVESECFLQSVLDLRSEILEQRHLGMTEILSDVTFIGIIDLERGITLVQHSTKLFIANHFVLGEELFYQLGLRQFGNFGRFYLKPAPNVSALVQLAVNYEAGAIKEAGLDPLNITTTIVQRLMDQRELLEEYFSVRINETGALESIPLLLNNYTPDLDRLPSFLLRLIPEVDWTNEKGCFQTILRELAYFYAPAAPLLEPNPEEIATSEDKAARWQIEHAVIPAIRAYLVPSKSLLEHRALVQVASLPDLYRVFERC